MTPAMTKYRLATGRWQQVLPGVYAVAGWTGSWEQRVVAALLWAGRAAVASHQTAGRIWQLEECDSEVVEISLPGRRRSPAKWLVVHRIDRTGPADAGSYRGYRVTTPTITLIDLAAVATEDVLECALEDALRRRLTTITKLETALRRLGGKGVPGTKSLRRLVAERGRSYVATRSQLEVRMNRIFKRCALPPVTREFRVDLPGGATAYIDFAYPELRLGIEVDGYGSHVGSKRQWQLDMRRENALKRLGWVVLHFSWEDVRDRPETVEREIREWLGRRQMNILGASEAT